MKTELKYTMESLVNEYGTGFGWKYIIQCDKEDFIRLQAELIEQVIGEEVYYGPRDVWDQIIIDFVAPLGTTINEMQEALRACKDFYDTHYDDRVEVSFYFPVSNGEMILSLEEGVTMPFEGLSNGKNFIPKEKILPIDYWSIFTEIEFLYWDDVHMSNN